MHHGLTFILRKMNDGIQRRYVPDGVLKLPTPVEPFKAADFRIKFFTEGA